MGRKAQFPGQCRQYGFWVARKIIVIDQNEPVGERAMKGLDQHTPCITKHAIWRKKVIEPVMLGGASSDWYEM